MRTTAIALLLLFATGCGYDPEQYAKSVISRNARVRNEGTEINIRAVAMALENYCTENNGYPVGTDYSVLDTTLSPDYMHVLPARDAWGFRYRYQSDGKSFRLTSVGRDGIAGTADDIVLIGGVPDS